MNSEIAYWYERFQSKNREFSIFTYTLFAPEILHKRLKCSWDTAYSKEHLKTKVYAKFGGKQSVP